ncbi:hypothetical protein CSKR_113439 [Clonorchis sinensis]|uniref:Uncharacterized protein n=1 Tax=Clonorchis sinensis TaxID=79923 RepID=A0A3R7CN67_CLOSI|nr:hypothetical protein CSKR_113439 [Clonorchis sinensis]
MLTKYLVLVLSSLSFCGVHGHGKFEPLKALLAEYAPVDSVIASYVTLQNTQPDPEARRSISQQTNETSLCQKTGDCVKFHIDQQENSSVTTVSKAARSTTYGERVSSSTCSATECPPERRLVTTKPSKPHVCQLCGERFTFPAFLKRHLAKHKGNVAPGDPDTVPDSLSPGTLKGLHPRGPLGMTFPRTQRSKILRWRPVGLVGQNLTLTRETEVIPEGIPGLQKLLKLKGVPLKERAKWSIKANPDECVIVIHTYVPKRAAKKYLGFFGIGILFIFTPLSFERWSSCSGVIISSSSAVHIQWPRRDLNPGHLTCEASVLPLLHQRTLDASEFSRLNRRTCSHLSHVIGVPDPSNDDLVTVLVVPRA